MSDRPMAPEFKPETFSPEEGSNVMISCAFSATAHELMANFKAILASPSAKQHKIKLFEVFAEISIHALSFLLTGDRVNEFLVPQIVLATSALSASDFLIVKLCKS